MANAFDELLWAQGRLDYWLSQGGDPAELGNQIRIKIFAHTKMVEHIISDPAYLDHVIIPELTKWVKASAQLNRLLLLDYTEDSRIFDVDVLEMLYGIWCVKESLEGEALVPTTMQKFLYDFTLKFQKLPPEEEIQSFMIGVAYWDNPEESVKFLKETLAKVRREGQ